MKLALLLVGPPYSGKSTWVEQYLCDKVRDDWVVASTDKWIEREARLRNTDYQSVFKDFIETASKLMNDEVQTAVRDRKNIIWDQTNLTISTRRKKLAAIPASQYQRVAVFFAPLDEAELKRRFADRSKVVGLDIVESMSKTLERPTLVEGFNEVWVVE